VLKHLKIALHYLRITLCSGATRC